MDAATAATYRRLRGVDRFERVTANVARLIGLQRQLGRTTPRVSLWFTATRANVDELPVFVRLAADLGVEEVYVQRLVFNGLGLATEANALHGRLRAHETARLSEAQALATGHGITMRASGLTNPLASLTASDDTRPWSGCQRPWTLAYVTANGNVLPCCISPWVARNYAGLILGNAFGESFEKIWDGTRYQRFRTDFETSTPPDPCRGCGRLWSI